jgi:dihydrofolate reductase
VRLSVVAAVARDGVIGRDGAIPWHIPEDVAHFKTLTTGHAVVMGRRTWESLPDRFRPLPGRRNVVVTRQRSWSADGAERSSSLDEALDLLASEERVFVIGGAELYAAALLLADELLLTEIDSTIEGDTVFPRFDREEFEETSRDRHGAPDGMPFAYVTYRRRNDGKQLAALASVSELLDRDDIDYWLFGGWAVDFYAGSVTRPHDDIDIAVWRDDLPRIVRLLERDGWDHVPYPDEDGGTGYECAGVRLELTYLVRKDDGEIVIPMRDFEATWPDGTFGDDVRELRDVRARLIGRAALARGKSFPRDDPEDAAKDRADSEILSKA